MVIGIDIGGTKMELAVFDAAFERRVSWHEPTPGRDYATFLRTLADMVRRAEDVCGARQTVGLALPGIVDQTARHVAVNVPCLTGKRVVRDIEDLLGRPVAYTNDTRAFALSESRGGALDGAEVALGVILGTGVAGTLCIDGRPLGAEGSIAGEYGHIAMAPNLLKKYGLAARICPCGAAGCVEQTLSGPGLLRLAAGVDAAYPSVEQWVADLHIGVGRAARVLDAYVDCLGYFISRLTLMLDPDVVVFGGGISNVAQIYGKLTAATKTYLFDGVRVPRVRAPTFGATSGARGAAILAWEPHGKRPDHGNGPT